MHASNASVPPRPNQPRIEELSDAGDIGGDEYNPLNYKKDNDDGLFDTTHNRPSSGMHNSPSPTPGGHLNLQPYVDETSSKQS